MAVARSRISRSSSLPATPEPLRMGEAGPPSPPRQRFRLKRRHASHLQAPTQQFLASVAAADVPIPSIEEPQVVDEDMADANASYYSRQPDMADFHGSDQASWGRSFSPPKTPAPGLIASTPRVYPDWAMESSFSSLESSPEYESSRPSTARSTQTSGSLFSRFSMTSDDFSQCISPDFEQHERFGDLLSVNDAHRKLKGFVPRDKQRRPRAPWTKPMSQHLWSTYLMYLQDPKVTPFRAGKSGIPPSGVCLRVAREAQRSWKGSNKQSKADSSEVETPKVRGPAPYIEWPHTCAATRAHLRDMCRTNLGSGARSSQHNARSPTPAGKLAGRLRNRRSPSVFSGNDMAVSLAVSTSDSMQIHGPLAQLTSSQPEPTTEPFPLLEESVLAPLPTPDEPLTQNLRSPFVLAKSYGPSSTNPNTSSLRASPEAQKQSQTVGPRRSLLPPVRLTRSRSNTQRRRERQSWLEPRRPKRPSLASDLWTDPSTGQEPAAATSTTADAPFEYLAPRANLQELFESRGPPKHVRGHAHALSLGAPMSMPPRLGSPFSFRSSSFSFPNRLSGPFGGERDAARKLFATVQQVSECSDVTTSTSLASRLAYLDDRLKDFRRRDAPRRRSESPL
jgi:hypothetical protein